MKNIAIGIFFVCCLTASNTAWSSLIYDGGTPNPATGGNLSDLESGIISADLIELATGPALVTELYWWGSYVAEVLIQDDFYIAVYPIVSGLPSEPTLGLLHIGNVNRQSDPTFTGIYQYSAELAAPLELPANTPLAVSIYNNSLAGFDDDWVWQTSGEGDGFAIPTDHVESSWAQTRDFAYSLHGTVVPEPSAAALTLVGSLLLIKNQRHSRG